MGEHKGAITLIIATLLLFGLFVTFGRETIGPLLTEIGTNFTELVRSVLPSIGS